MLRPEPEKSEENAIRHLVPAGGPPTGTAGAIDRDGDAAVRNPAVTAASLPDGWLVPPDLANPQATNATTATTVVTTTANFAFMSASPHRPNACGQLAHEVTSHLVAFGR